MTRAAAIGFRAKTGRAISVALVGSVEAPELLWRREVALIDPEIPETSQPYHEVMDLPWEQSLEGVRPWVARIELLREPRSLPWFASLPARDGRWLPSASSAPPIGLFTGHPVSIAGG